MSDVDKIQKQKNKIASQIDNIFNQHIMKNIISDFKSDEGRELYQSLREHFERISHTVLKEINDIPDGSKNLGEPICTVTASKVYKEMDYEELENKIATGHYVIKGDDGSKYKSANALRKFYK